MELQRQLMLSDFGRAMARLGALADEFPVEQLKEDVDSFQKYREVCQSARGIFNDSDMFRRKALSANL